MPRVRANTIADASTKAATVMFRHNPEDWRAYGHFQPSTNAATQQGISLKGAARAAAMMEDDFLAVGWPCGRVFASLDEVARRYHIGRAIALEACRILELRGACKIRRGPRGGIIIAAPTISRVSITLSFSMLNGETNLAQLIDARQMLDGYWHQQVASSKATPDNLPDIRQDNVVPGHESEFTRLIASHYQHRQRLVDLLDNPGATLFNHCLNDMIRSVLASLDAAAIEPTLRRLSKKYQTVLRQMLAATAPAERQKQATAAANICVEIDRHCLHGRTPEQRLAPLAMLPSLSNDPATVPHAIRIARSITEDVLAGRWAPGTRIGNELDLCDAFEVSQMTLRQAIRLLEDYEIAEMHTGRGNGLFVASHQTFLPVLRTAHDFFASRRWTGQSWWLAHRPIQTSLVMLADGHADDDVRRQLAKMLDAVDNAGELDAQIDAEGEIAQWMWGLAGNPILELFSRIMVSYRHRTVNHGAPTSLERRSRFSRTMRDALRSFAAGPGKAAAAFDKLLGSAASPAFPDWVTSPYFHNMPERH